MCAGKPGQRWVWVASELFERAVLAMGDKVPAWGSWDYPASLIVKPLVGVFKLSRDCVG